MSETTKNRWRTVTDMPVKHLDMQVTMKTHLSQSTGTGAFDGQHGISSAISSIMADVDISSRHRRHRSLRWCPRHDRPGNRRHYKARDHQDREQPTYGEIAVHRIKLSQTSGDKKATSLKVMELYLSCIDQYQIANKFDVRDGCPAQPIDATQELNLSAGVSNCKVLRGRSLS